ncbi:MAG TPA: putative sulfate/molybdate transporter [Steroidobacteraceae bacterium]|nr:putative sulfate/molybdate transporter [Steroidobacteraceae bacterium]
MPTRLRHPLVRSRLSSLANRFDRMEWAGAFGDLGTFLPFVIAYISVVRVPPAGILLSFGLALVLCGLYYRTPFPVQPMKGIGAIAATQAAKSSLITPATLYAADLVTGLIWLVLGLTGSARYVARWVPGIVVSGIVLGLGMSFMLEGIRMMSADWLIASIGLAGTLLLLASRAIPVMFLLLLFGAVCTLIQNPSAMSALSSVRFALHAPAFALASISWRDLLAATALLALPQLPLTLGNALIATREENNRLFPERPVSESSIATSTGLMNLTSSVLGGVPMCHGVGGLAGQVTFGARTGGAPIIFGTLLLVLALGFSDAVQSLFNIFPHAVLGVILFIAGGQLALGCGELSRSKVERFVTFITAAFTVWNVGVAFLVGIALTYLAGRGRLRL